MQTTVIDWLQMHVSLTAKRFENTDCKYHIEKTDYGTRHFRELYYIYDRPGGNEIAVLCAVPVQPMDDNFGLLKINNRCLYQQNLKGYVIDLLKDLKLQFVGITRIDIAHDFTTDHSKINPEKFISNYLTGEYVKKGKAKGKNVMETSEKTSRKTFNKLHKDVLASLEKSKIQLTDAQQLKLQFNLKRQTKSNYKYTAPDKAAIGFENGKQVNLESLKFGTEKSELSYILYNKTKQMQDVEHKQWICDNWTDNGWDGNAEVWRLEFSFKSSTKKFIEVSDGETIDFKTMDMLDNIGNIWNYHYQKYFFFVHNTGKCRRDRERKVAFLKTVSHNYISMKLSGKKIAKRSDKIFAKKLKETNAELRGVDFDLAIYGSDYLTHFVNTRGLNKWAERKLFYKGTDKMDAKKSRDQYDINNIPIAYRLIQKVEKPVFDFDCRIGTKETNCIPQVIPQFLRDSKYVK